MIKREIDRQTITDFIIDETKHEANSLTKTKAYVTQQ